MRFSRNWVRRYVELPERIEDLSGTLTNIGLAVEGVEAAGDDYLLDLEITTNRPDCMNHIGLAREVAAALDVDLVEPTFEAPEAVHSRKNPWGSIVVDDPEGCPRYVGVFLRGIRVAPSPSWLTTQLEAIGVRPINNVVDVTNYVLWEYGQPLHAFDLDRLRRQQVIIRRALPNEKLVTLDGEERELDPEILTIADAEGAIALAGIMGGLESEVTEETQNVLVESAHFDPKRVRLGAKKLGMHTDASHRFERGADSEICLEAALRAASLLVDLAGGQLEPVTIDVWPPGSVTPAGVMSLEELISFCGVEIPKDFVEKTMRRLGFELTAVGTDGAAWQIRVPSWRRFDFETNEKGIVYPAYFYEEVLRHFGFDRVPATVPAAHGPDRGESRGYRLREVIRDYLAAAGLCEVVNYSFGSEISESRFEFLAQGNFVEISNALSDQYSHLQRSLLPGLLESALFNLRRGAEVVRLFETGHLFQAASEELDAVAVSLGGSPGSAWARGAELDLFDLKGVVEGLARRLGVDLEFRAAEVKGFVPGTSAEILALSSEGAAQKVGHLGKVDEIESGTALYSAELLMTAFERTTTDGIEPPSRYPSVRTDLTLTHSLETAWSEIASAIRSLEVRDLDVFELKDRYAGDSVPEGAVNTTIGFQFNAADRSLTHEEVNARHEQLTEQLVYRFGLGEKS